MTAKLALAVPDVLEALQLTVVVPIGNTLPDAGVHVTVAPGGLLVTVNVTTAPALEVASALMSGRSSARAGVSATATGAANAMTAATMPTVNPARRAPRRRWERAARAWRTRVTGPALTDS